MGNKQQEFIWVKNEHLSVMPFTSLEQRIAASKPHLLAGLLKLREILGEESFEKYINPLHNLSRNDTALLVLAGSAHARTHIVRECIPALQEAFSVRVVRVIGK
jgi:hypothetical protein